MGCDSAEGMCGGELAKSVGEGAHELFEGVLWGEYSEEVTEWVNWRGLETSGDTL